MDNYIITRTEGRELEFSEKLLKNINQFELRELRAVCAGCTELEALRNDIEHSEECWKVETEKGEPLAVYGRRTVDEGMLIWCLCTDLMQKYKVPFIRTSRKILFEWASKYGPLFNAVGDFNRPSKAWLKSLGARFLHRQIISGEEFIVFVLRKEDMKCVV